MGSYPRSSSASYTYRSASSTSRIWRAPAWNTSVFSRSRIVSPPSIASPTHGCGDAICSLCRNRTSGSQGPSADVDGCDAREQILVPYADEACTDHHLGERFLRGPVPDGDRQVAVRVAVPGGQTSQPGNQGEGIPVVGPPHETVAWGAELEHGEPSAGTKNPADLAQRCFRMYSIANAEADGGDVKGAVP